MNSTYLEQKKKFTEAESFQMTFILKDDKNDVLSVTDLADYKFYAEITNNAYELKKYDVNYAAGAITQIATSGKTVIVYIEEDDTENFEGTFAIEVYAVHKTNGNKYNFYKESYLFFMDTITD